MAFDTYGYSTLWSVWAEFKQAQFFDGIRIQAGDKLISNKDSATLFESQQAADYMKQEPRICCPNCGQPVVELASAAESYPIPAKYRGSQGTWLGFTYSLDPCGCRVDGEWAAAFGQEKYQRLNGKPPLALPVVTPQARQNKIDKLTETISSLHSVRAKATTPDDRKRAEYLIVATVDRLMRLAPGAHNFAFPNIVLSDEVRIWVDKHALQLPSTYFNSVPDPIWNIYSSTYKMPPVFQNKKALESQKSQSIESDASVAMAFAIETAMQKTNTKTSETPQQLYGDVAPSQSAQWGVKRWVKDEEPQLGVIRGRAEALLAKNRTNEHAIAILLDRTTQTSLNFIGKLHRANEVKNNLEDYVRFHSPLSALSLEVLAIFAKVVRGEQVSGPEIAAPPTINQTQPEKPTKRRVMRLPETPRP